MQATLPLQKSSFGPVAVAIYQTLESYDVDAEQVIRDAGVELSRLQDPTTRLEPSVLRRIVGQAVQLTGDCSFGLRFSDYVHPTSFHALGLALLSSSTLSAFCKRWVRYHSFITTMGQVTFDEAVREPVLVFPSQLPNRDSLVGRAMIDGQIATVLKLIRFMYQPDYFPRRVELICPMAPDTRHVYEEYYGPDVQFSAARNGLYFDPADLTVRLPAANAELARLNDEVVVKFLARLEKADVVARAHSKLIELLPSGHCCKAEVARGLHMSVRTLHNRLTEAGTTYQQLLDRTRRELAEQYMQQPNVSVSEVAYLLGFSDCSNFSRAFHRWTGRSPSVYREQARAGLYPVN